jgi:acyl-coenzyme A synthetase/AMP-(fatty) acid ligase
VQVKVNGYRVELAEVELALSASKYVKQAVVIVRDCQLAAYIMLNIEVTGEDENLISQKC